MTKQHTYCKLQLVTVLWIVQLYSSYSVQTIQLNVLQTAQFRWVADHSASSIIIVLHLQKSETRMTASVRKFADCVSVSINQPYIWNRLCVWILHLQTTQPSMPHRPHNPRMLKKHINPLCYRPYRPVCYRPYNPACYRPYNAI